MQVITYLSPNGAGVSLTPAQAETLMLAGAWPKDEQGQTYGLACGQHEGHPTFSDEEILDMCFFWWV